MTAQLKLTTWSPESAVEERIRLADLFHRINRVLPADQEIVKVGPDTTVRGALKLMQEHGFSQLPVLEGREVLGIFSYRSLATTLLVIDTTKQHPVELLVEDAMDIVDANRFAHVNDELHQIFDALDRHEAVLVGEPGKLQGIVTTMDVLRYLNAIAFRFIVLGEIELSIRALLQHAMSEEEIQVAAVRVLRHYKPEDLPTRLEDMTFSDYVMLLGHGDIWKTCCSAFGGDRDRTRVKLMSLAKLRNDVFHFKRELADDDDHELWAGRDWLLTRARLLDARAANGGRHE